VHFAEENLSSDEAGLKVEKGKADSFTFAGATLKNGA
jgi:hypothetical protein